MPGSQMAASDRFRGAWRPILGWGLTLGTLFHFLVAPAIAFLFALVTGRPFPAPLPTLGESLLAFCGSTLAVLIGARTVEKVKAPSHQEPAQGS